jgi:hypothetical protein
VDWGIVVTGVVGLAGIGGALLSVRMTSNSAADNLRTTISAEAARARLAEKRRIYANCLVALTAYTHAAGSLAQGAELSPAEYAGLEEDSDRTRMAAVLATSEVYLIGPPEVIKLANRTFLLALGAETGNRIDDPAKAIAELAGAMRRDLGENVPPSEQMPDVLVFHQADPESASPDDVTDGTRAP